MGTKGAGASLYLDVDSDDQYREIGCIRQLKPPGLSRGVNTEPPCLNSSGVPVQDTDDVAYTEGQAVVDHEINETLDTEIRAAITADTQIKVCLKYNTATPVYEYFEAKLTQYDGQNIERNQTIRRTLNWIQRTASTFNTTAPTAEA